MSYEYVLTVGDWSCDGHSFYHQYLLKSNKPKSEIINAYKESVLASNIVFHNNDAPTYHKFCVDYGSDSIEDEDINLMESYGVNIKAHLEESTYGGYVFETPENFANLFMEFIKKQLPDLKYEIIDKTSDELEGLEILNGWWTEFNFGIGYGIYTGDNHEEDYHGDTDEDYDEEYEDD